MTLKLASACGSPSPNAARYGALDKKPNEPDAASKTSVVGRVIAPVDLALRARDEQLKAVNAHQRPGVRDIHTARRASHHPLGTIIRMRRWRRSGHIKTPCAMDYSLKVFAVLPCRE